MASPLCLLCRPVTDIQTARPECILCIPCIGMQMIKTMNFFLATYQYLSWYHLWINTWVCTQNRSLTTCASEVVSQQEALYQVPAPLPMQAYSSNTMASPQRFVLVQNLLAASDINSTIPQYDIISVTNCYHLSRRHQTSYWHCCQHSTSDITALCSTVQHDHSFCPGNMASASQLMTVSPEVRHSQSPFL